MVKSIKRLIIGASVFASVSAIASAPAFAGSIKNTAITGTAPYLVYDADNTNTFLVPSNPVNVNKVLDGDKSTPTGNVELFSNSETLDNAAFASYTGTTSLQGTIGGKAITLSSLTLTDWNTTLSSGKTLGQQWFGDLLTANNLLPLLGTNTESEIFTSFTENGGLQRFSDPNISYVNQDSNGLIRIGLAGHFNATSLIQTALQPTQTKLKNLFDTAQTGFTNLNNLLKLAQANLTLLQNQRTTLLAQLAAAPNSQKPLIQTQVNALNSQITTVQAQISSLSGQIQQTNLQIAALSAKLNPLTAFVNNTNLQIQASELVKVSYNGQAPQYLYNFTATNSGLVSKDGTNSHNGNYEVTLQGEKPSQPVPEPSAIIGLVSLGGLFAAKRKSAKQASA
jgi:hypothetical protein